MYRRARAIHQPFVWEILVVHLRSLYPCLACSHQQSLQPRLGADASRGGGSSFFAHLFGLAIGGGGGFGEGGGVISPFPPE